MEVHFRNIYLERLYRGLHNPGKPKFDDKVIRVFRLRIKLFLSLDNTNQLKQFKGLNFEALKGDKKGLYSLRIDLKYRLEFSIDKNIITFKEIILVENLSNHYK
ncbi:MAG: type II toxin-antitoxin system RelE/ParE family toxin [Chitinophagaceae bacterium]